MAYKRLHVRQIHDQTPGTHKSGNTMMFGDTSQRLRSGDVVVRRKDRELSISPCVARPSAPNLLSPTPQSSLRLQHLLCAISTNSSYASDIYKRTSNHAHPHCRRIPRSPLLLKPSPRWSTQVSLDNMSCGLWTTSMSITE